MSLRVVDCHIDTSLSLLISIYYFTAREKTQCHSIMHPTEGTNFKIFNPFLPTWQFMAPKLF